MKVLMLCGAFSQTVTRLWKEPGEERSTTSVIYVALMLFLFTLISSMKRLQQKHVAVRAGRLETEHCRQQACLPVNS